MLRTTIVGSWPPDPRYHGRLASYRRGALSVHAAEALLVEMAATAIAQQQACGLTSYTGGETAADTFILHFPHWLTGIVPSARTDAWGGRGTYQIVDTLDAPHGLGIAAAFRRERAIDSALPKVTIPGPSEITMMLEPREERERSWPRAIELIRAEIAQLVEIGAREVQLDVPHIAMGLADGGWDAERSVATIAAVFAGVRGVTRSVHFCYGDFEARTWTRNQQFAPLLPTIRALAGTMDRVVLEFSLPEQWAQRDLLREIPDGIEVAAGIVDVKNPQIETAAEIREKAEALLRHVPAERLLLCPSCGFGRRDVPMAIGKVIAMVQAAQRIGG